MFQTEVLRQFTQGYAEDSLVYRVVSDFTATMLEPLILRYSLYPAKGSTRAGFAHNADQPMVTHLLNGLLPVLSLVYEAQKRDCMTGLSAEELKVYMLAYAMHDLDKVLEPELKPNFNAQTGLNAANACRLVAAELESLNAGAFLPGFEAWVAEILWLALNTQRKWGISLYWTTFEGLEESLQSEMQQLNESRQRLLRDLCTMSDLIAFVIKAPEDATNVPNLTKLLAERTDNQFSLVYHKLADVRGFLSNLINNATMRYLEEYYAPEEDRLIPFLFFPDGVVYLNPRRRPDPVIDRTTLYAAVRQELAGACQDFVKKGDSFGFSQLGLMKYPAYFHDFLSPAGFLEVFSKKALESKANVAESTLQKMKEMQAAGTIPLGVSLNYVADERVAALGRFLTNYTRLIEEHLGKAAPEGKTELQRRLAARLGETNWSLARQVPSSGGLDYRFYWLAAQYLKAHPGLSLTEEGGGHSLQSLFEELAAELLEVAGPQLAEAPGLQGPYLRYLPDYLDRYLSFSFEPAAVAAPDWAGELAKYTNAKRPRESSLPCTLCNSAYPSAMQEDASVLFQPWVYKNRLPLHKGSNAGGICSICSLELMLRQVLLTDRPEGQGQLRLTGKKFEAQELKYFFIYPDFFFTRQTFAFANWIIKKLRELKLYELCEELRAADALTSHTLLNLSFFNLTAGELRRKERVEQDRRKEKTPAGERPSLYLMNRYDQRQYPGFIFFAKKTAGGDTSTASWVEAAWLGLALPLVLGAKVVVTEMYLPLYASSASLLETVVLDAPHQAVRHLLPATVPAGNGRQGGLSPETRLRLDQLYGPVEQRTPQNEIGGALAAFSRAIEIHIDTERRGGDLKLDRFNRIARDLATDRLFVFSFLQEQVRDKSLSFMSFEKAYHYNRIYRQLETIFNPDQIGGVMTRHEKVVELYLKFYSPFSSDGGYPKSHAILRPLDVAAKGIIEDTLNLTPDEIKLELVGKLRSWLEIVRKGNAGGRATGGKEEELRVREFVDYFYDEIFMGYAEGQRSLLNSRLNRFKNGCEAAFTIINRERRLKRQAEEQSEGAAPGEEAASVNENTEL